MASYGGQQEDNGSSSQPRKPQQSIMNPQTGLPLEFHQQLTPQEVETMTTIRRNASRARTTGGVLGASAAGLYLLRKKRSILSFRYFMGCFGGSLLGSWLFVPIGVAWSSSMVKKVENPEHLVEILTNASKARMKAQRPEPLPRPGQGLARDQPTSMDPAAESMSSMQPPAPTPPPTRTSARSRGTQTNQWGDEINGPDTSSYSNEAANAPPAYQYNAAQTGSNSNPNPSGMADNDGDQSNQSLSRWAQLRGQRQVQESSWEKIRQENARDAYNRQAASGKGRPDQVAFSTEPNYAGQSSGDMADPDFGKGSSPSRTQAQREYEKSFERERRGVDV